SLYVAGGANREGSGFTTNESFSPAKNAWATLASLPQSTIDAGSAVDAGQLYCFGGWANVSGTVLDNVQIYQP
ncbi:MAG TPA: hypothetical protein VIX14_14305, partial [Terriglobales bacterium]